MKKLLLLTLLLFSGALEAKKLSKSGIGPKIKTQYGFLLDGSAIGANEVFHTVKNLKIGKVYRITWSFSINCDTVVSECNANAKINHNGVELVSIPVASDRTASYAQLAPHTLDIVFTATASTATLVADVTIATPHMRNSQVVVMESELYQLFDFGL